MTVRFSKNSSYRSSRANQRVDCVEQHYRVPLIHCHQLTNVVRPGPLNHFIQERHEITEMNLKVSGFPQALILLTESLKA